MSILSLGQQYHLGELEAELLQYSPYNLDSQNVHCYVYRNGVELQTRDSAFKERIFLEEKQLQQLSNLLCLWNDRRISYAGYILSPRGYPGVTAYFPPGKTKHTFQKYPPIPFGNSVARQEKISGQQKIAECYTNNEMVAEVFDFSKGVEVKLERFGVEIEFGYNAATVSKKDALLLDEHNAPSIEEFLLFYQNHWKRYKIFVEK